MRRAYADLPADERPDADGVAHAFIIASRHFGEWSVLVRATEIGFLSGLSGRVRLLAGWMLKTVYPDLKGVSIARMVGLDPVQLAPSIFVPPRNHPVKAAIDRCVIAFCEAVP
ncbi:MAG: hypothetical protein RLZZ157_82 [Pseudomonadota bacterium]|jgi:hypothetical protein